MARSKKHHFLPQTYLREFSTAGTGEQIWQIEKTMTARHYHVNIRDAAQQSDYHTVPTSVEELNGALIEGLLSPLEDQQQRVVRRLISGRPLTAYHLDRLAEFVGLMRVRVPTAKAEVESILTTSVRTMTKFRAKGDRVDRDLETLPSTTNLPTSARAKIARGIRKMVENDEFNVEIENFALLDMMFKTAFDPELLSIVRAMSMTVVESPPQAGFITCDTPVVLYSAEATKTNPYGFGLAHKSIEVSVPLTTRHLLRLDWSGRGLCTMAASVAEVSEYNRRTVVMANRFIYSGELRDEFIEMVRHNHDKRAGFAINVHGNPSTDSGVLMMGRSVPVMPRDHY